MSHLHGSESSIGRDTLLEETMKFLGLPETRRSSLSGRIDALLTSGKILGKERDLYLHPSTKQSLQIADGIYVKELGQLSASQVDLLAEYGGNWDQKKSEEVSLLLTQSFIYEQIKTAKHASLSFTMTGFGSYIDSPIDKLKEIIRDSGVSHKDVNEVINKIIDLARETPLIKKLTNSVTFVALETSDSGKTSAILGRSSWKDIKVILDASVAIPYLASSLFAHSSGRFSRGSNESISMLKEHGAKLTIPLVYLNECSSHLVNGLEYARELHELEDSFKYSQNGYVAHYYQLKEAKLKVPNTLK